MSGLKLSFEELDAPEGWEYPESEVKLAKILHKYLTSEPCSENLFEDTANSILAILKLGTSKGELVDEHTLWSDMVLMTAEQIPFHHEAQARLIRLLRPMFNSPKVSKPEDDKGVPMATVNFHAFVARPHSIGVFGPDPMYGVWAMRAAFENTPDKNLEKKFLVMAAAQYILWNGSDFFNYFLFPSLENRIAKELKHGSLYTDGGEHFLSMERWRFWKTSFAGFSMSEDEKNDEECRTVALKARNLMEALEVNMMF